MPERKEFLQEILGNKDRPDEAGARGTRAPGAGGQAFTLRADYKDGRRKRGTAWSHFSDYEWTDDGDREKLVVLFGTRMVTSKATTSWCSCARSTKESSRRSRNW